MSDSAAVPGKLAAACLKLPIYAYRYTLSPLIGQRCRHLPTCSEYALGAIDRNGAWRGFWLTVSRLLRCNPWGTSGFDPGPGHTRRASPVLGGVALWPLACPRHRGAGAHG